MSFKENLKNELVYQGIFVKELSAKSGVSKRTLDNYLRAKESQPTAENAVKIAQALGVTVEYLVTGTMPDKNSKKKSDEPQIDMHLYKKYISILQKLDSLPDSTREPICELIKNIL